MVCGLMILAGIYGSIEVGFCWSGQWYVVLLLILDDLDVLLLIWLDFDLLVLEICLKWNFMYLVEFVLWEMLENKIFEYDVLRSSLVFNFFLFAFLCSCDLVCVLVIWVYVLVYSCSSTWSIYVFLCFLILLKSIN